MGDSGPPVMLLVTSDDESRAILDGELRRRYAADYEVVTTGSYEHARAILDGLRHWQRDVAMVLACYSPADRDGLTFLRRARNLHPSAKRAIVVTWGEFASASAVFRAIAEGHAEVQLIRPERPRDEEFHGSITDVLDDWHLTPRLGLRGRPDHRPDRRAHPRPPRRLRPQPHPDRLLPGRLGGRPPHAGGPRPRRPRAAGARPRVHRATHDAREPHRHRDRGRLRADDPAVGRPRLRRRDHRRRPGGSGRRGLRRLGGPVHPRGRAPGRRRAGRHELADPQLPRVLARHQRGPPRLPGLPAGLVLRRRVHLHARGRSASRSTAPNGSWSSPTGAASGAAP